jgi:putative transposase
MLNASWIPYGGSVSTTSSSAGERHLGGILKSHSAYYHRSRTHLSLRKETPVLRKTHPPAMGEIVARPEVGGLHHRYERLAA